MNTRDTNPPGNLTSSLSVISLSMKQGVRMGFTPTAPSASGTSLVPLVPKTSGRSDKVKGIRFQSRRNRYG